MASFPQLRTGAIAQYPSRKSTEYSTHVVTFLDGSEQRCRERKNAGRRWSVTLDLLDESEANGLETFFVAQQGQFGTFDFVNPWEQALLTECAFEQGFVEFVQTIPSQITTAVLVKKAGH